MPLSMWRMIARTPRWARIMAVVVLAGAIILGVPAVRPSVLRAAGWALVANDGLEPSDIIVIAVDAGGAGVLEAADLVHAGIAPRVAVFAGGPPDSVEREFARRGIAYEGPIPLKLPLLKALGVTAIELIPTAVAGTTSEADALSGWCAQRRFQSIVVVSATDHSRRLRRMLRRAMKNHQTRVIIRPARHSTFDPDRWWETRAGVRTEIIEIQKLLFDVIRHPIS
jgi:uncharacterized SAM-binding protein YcdF (DUF218 family)